MPHRIVKQPDGQYCIYSTIVDNVIVYNASPEEIMNYYILKSAKEIRSNISQTIAALDGGGKPYFQFTETFEEMMDNIADRHGEDARAELLKNMENPPEDHSPNPIDVMNKAGVIALFQKYMKHIVSIEGVSYVNKSSHEVEFSPEEIQLLEIVEHY